MILKQTRDGWFGTKEPTSEDAQQQVDEELRSQLHKNPELLKFLQLSEPQHDDDSD